MSSPGRYIWWLLYSTISFDIANLASLLVLQLFYHCQVHYVSYWERPTRVLEPVYGAGISPPDLRPAEEVDGDRNPKRYLSSLLARV